jgi:hypothetical protein
VITAEALAGSFGFAEAFAALVTSASTACEFLLVTYTPHVIAARGSPSFWDLRVGSWCPCCANLTHLEAVRGGAVFGFHSRFETIAEPELERGDSSGGLKSPDRGVQRAG